MPPAQRASAHKLAVERFHLTRFQQKLVRVKSLLEKAQRMPNDDELGMLGDFAEDMGGEDDEGSANSKDAMAAMLANIQGGGGDEGRPSISAGARKSMRAGEKAAAEATSEEDEDVGAESDNERSPSLAERAAAIVAEGADGALPQRTTPPRKAKRARTSIVLDS